MCSLRVALNPLLGDKAPLVVFLSAPVIAAFYGDLFASTTATILSLLVGELLFVEPRGSLGPVNLAEIARIVIYVLQSAVFSYLVTTRKTAFTELKERTRRLTQILEAAPAAMAVVDDKGHIVLVNQRMSEMFGYTLRELHSITVDELLPDDMRAEHAAQRQAYLRNPQARLMGPGLDLWAKRKDGTTFPVEVGLNPLVSGTEALILTSITDVSARRTAQVMLLERERQFAAMFTNSPVAKYVVEPADGTILDVNELGAEQLGYEREALIGMSLGDLDANTTKTPFSQYRQQIARRTRFQFDAAHRTKDGRRREVHVWVQGLDIGGRLRALVVAQDVTDRKLLEHELRMAARQKDEFLAMLAHELRNPLAPLTLGLTLLGRSKSLPATERRSVDMLQRQTKHLTHLVNDLLEMARLTKGKVTLVREPVILQDLVRQAYESLRNAFEQKQLTFLASMPAQPLVVEGDRSRLHQVLENIFHNAAKFTPAGGRVQVALENIDGKARLSVEDTGVGLAPEHLERVFEMFSQFNTGLDRSEGGLGLGLSVAQLLVQMHGGTLIAQSAGIGQGSKFSLELPEAHSQAMPALLPASTPSRQDVPMRVLVVDDNRDAADVLGELLQAEGYTVTVAYDAAQALKAAQQHPPHLAFLDIGMPRINGYELARALRLEHGPELLMVALTGYGQPNDKQQARDAGFDRHLLKPAESGQVLQLAAGRREKLAAESV